MEEIVGLLNVICVWLCLIVLLYIPQAIYFIHECMAIDKRNYKKNLEKDVKQILQERENAQK